MKTQSKTVPQVMAIVRCAAGGLVRLRKIVIEYLGGDGSRLNLTRNGEVQLRAWPSSDSIPVELSRGRLQLPAAVSQMLGLEAGSLLAMIERPAAIALKRFELKECVGDRARVLDHEEDRLLTRISETNPMPVELIPRLKQKYRDAGLQYDIRPYLAGRRTLQSWISRRVLDLVEAGDERLRNALVEARLEEQDADGSWGGQIVRTARMLRELAELDLTADDERVRRGVAWLLDRPQSAVNPGMFFLSDGLVAEQARIVAARNRGERLRFRERKRSEIRAVTDAETLAHDPCGPRIMWPNAIVLEALPSLGYEDSPRVQAALRTLRMREWCECGYQHGLTAWRQTEPMTTGEMDALESAYRAQYRYGGIESLEELSKMDLGKKVGEKMPRVAQWTEGTTRIYTLDMPGHQQPCELVTTRAMSRVQDEPMQRFARAHLWRIAGRQHGPDGRFVGAYKHVDPYFYLQLFASYDHPVAKVAILRSLPWIIDAQKPDGSWGKGPGVGSATLATLSALIALGKDLPFGLWHS